MTTWQVDFYRRPLQDQQGAPLWELVICTPNRSLEFSAFCPQPQATLAWLTAQLQLLVAQNSPVRVQVFRPQSLSLITAACEQLGISVEPTRQTRALKQLLQDRAREYSQMPGYTGAAYDPLHLEKPPPQPLPEKLWGQSWQFATLAATDLEEGLIPRPIPILQAPKLMLPSQLQLAKSTRIPGVVIYGGRQSMQLAQWLHSQHPADLGFIAGAPSGLVLAAGLADRWILVTFEDSDIAAAAAAFEQRKQASRGLHFLLVQPDDSGITYSGLWLLQKPDFVNPTP